MRKGSGEPQKWSNPPPPCHPPEGLYERKQNRPQKARIIAKGKKQGNPKKARKGGSGNKQMDAIFSGPMALSNSAKPKGPSRSVLSTESDSVVFYYSVVNVLRMAIHYSKYSKSVQNVGNDYIFSSESPRVANSLQIVNSLRVFFLACQGPLGMVVRMVSEHSSACVSRVGLSTK